ncbi:MAG: PD40 domain-containing protein [Muribaculaceae bacterium]|nr:PD40 domain-containing protein [Muribaculaceae bacterium]
MKRLFFASVLGLTLLGASAATPLWLRDVKISPDGQQIAFCYKGDIFKVDASGGQAVRLTTLPSYDCSPVWSADSRQIAFASDRNGNFDIFVMPATGGQAKRLTTNSASEKPTAFSPDGKWVYFNASIQDPAESALYPTALPELYKVPTAGGKTRQVLATPAEMICFLSDGKSFLYHDRKGYEDEFRKHHTSSVTRDIWRYDALTGKHTNLTQRGGEDRNPVISTDGSTVYFLSERNGGSFNVYSFNINSPATVKSLTSFKTHPCRFLSADKNDRLCFAYDGEIYTLAKGGKPKKVNIDVIEDDENTIQVATVRGGSNAVVSPDGKQIAFIARGDVFVTSVEYGTTKQITSTPEAERWLSWGADNRSLAYASERGGNWKLFIAKLPRKEDLNFPNATLIEEESILADEEIERTAPSFSPDGKKLAFIEDRTKLMVFDTKNRKAHQVTDGSQWYSTAGSFNYEWSPDGKWFVLDVSANHRDPYTDVAIVPSEGGKVTPITASGYFCQGGCWVMDGNAILFGTDRYGMRSHASWGSLEDVMLCFVNQEAYDKYLLSKEDLELQKELEKMRADEEKKAEADKKKTDKKDEKKDDKKAEKKEEKAKDIVVELDGITDRVVRLTPYSSSLSGALLTKDGETLYYIANFDGQAELRKLGLRKRDDKQVTKVKGGGNIQMSKDGKTMFVLGATFQKLVNDKLTPITPSATLQIDRGAEREYMFDHVYKQEKKRFYTEKMHGVDWDAMTKAYRRFLPHINNNYDFANLLSEWLGELNVSHTGGRYRPRLSTAVTASLGLLYDWNYEGKGLKVSEVVEKGPFNKKPSKMTAGCIIEKINGVEIDENTDFSALMADLAKKKTLVTFRDASGAKIEEVVTPITSTQFKTLLEARWVKQRAADVDRWSKGRLGYVYISSMNDASYREIYADILGKYNDREGIVIDTRWNGGGRLHEDLEILFSGKKYFEQVIRGRRVCDMPSRRWNKPSIMVQCEANYSNAHGSPWVYKHTGIGRLVGMPVPGTMTSVSWETLQDPTLVFGIPVIGYRLPDGSYLENSQLEPDIKVANAPETIVKGEDTQLRTAVEELLREIDNKKIK